MPKSISKEERKKILAKFGGKTLKKVKKLKHPPKQKKEEEIVSVQGDVHSSYPCCKKQIIPVNGKEHAVNGKHPQNHVPKKIKIVPVPPLHVGSSVL